MKRSDLIKELSYQFQIPQPRAKAVIDLLFDSFIHELKRNGKIEIRGFGSFRVKGYKAYTGRNPRTGALVDVKSKKGVVFRVGRELRDFFINQTKT